MIYLISPDFFLTARRLLDQGDVLGSMTPASSQVLTCASQDSSMGLGSGQ